MNELDSASSSPGSSRAWATHSPRRPGRRTSSCTTPARSASTPSRRCGPPGRAGDPQAATSPGWWWASWGAWPSATASTSSSACPWWTSCAARASSTSSRPARQRRAHPRALLATTPPRGEPERRVPRAPPGRPAGERLAPQRDARRGGGLARTARPLAVRLAADHRRRAASARRMCGSRAGATSSARTAWCPSRAGPRFTARPSTSSTSASKLADAGVIEITLLGQTVNHYRFEHGAAVTSGAWCSRRRAGRTRAATGATPSRRERDDLRRPARRIHEEVPGDPAAAVRDQLPARLRRRRARGHPRPPAHLPLPARAGAVGLDRMLKLMNRGYTVGSTSSSSTGPAAFLDQPEKGAR
jgi:hypothetical protein